MYNIMISYFYTLGNDHRMSLVNIITIYNVDWKNKTHNLNTEWNARFQKSYKPSKELFWCCEVS